VAEVRLFVALELPEEVRARLWAWSGGLDEIAWRRVPPERLHVTLAFLGERPSSDVAAIAAVLEGCAAGAGPVALRCAGVVALPRRRPRVVAAELEDAGGALESLQRAVGEGLVAAGVYEPERRPFLAHVTVGRSRRHGGGGPEALGDPACAFEAPAVTLFSSRPDGGGPRYSPLASVAL